LNRQDHNPDQSVGKRRIRRTGAVVLVAALGFGGSLALAPGAMAATPSLGGMNFSPATGTDITPFNFTTVSSGSQKGCPVGATNALGLINGPAGSGWTDIIGLSNTSTGVTSTDDISLPVVDTMFGIAQVNALTIVPGAYTFTIKCQNRFGTTQYGTYDQVFTFTDATHFTSTPVATGTATTTALSIAPVSPQDSGTALTLTATVSQSAAAGTVQFKDGANNLGTAQAVSGGVATLTTSALAVGSHSLTAVFTPTGTGFLGSTSAASTFVVNQGAAAGTTTGLSSSATAVQGSPVTFTIAVTPSNATGTVVLKEGTTTLGSGAVSGGAASVDVTFATVGAHNVVAQFVPTGNFAGSTSQPTTVNVTAAASPTASETIRTTVAAGSLTISVANTAPVILPTPTLDQSAGLLVTNGPINPVTVTDTRAGAPGFVVSGQVTDFLSGANKINGYNLGWTPNVIDKATGMTVTAGAPVAPASGLQPGTTPSDATKGLKSARQLALNAAGGIGTAHFGADLSLYAPTNTAAGTYDATLTLTAI
jgi:hypothetical protein